MIYIPNLIYWDKAFIVVAVVVVVVVVLFGTIKLLQFAYFLPFFLALQLDMRKTCLHLPAAAIISLQRSLMN